MVTYNISTGVGWQNLPNVLNSGDVVNFTSNFTFTTTNIATKKEFPTGAILNGNFYIITYPLNENNINGILKLTGGTVKNIYINANNSSTFNSSGGDGSSFITQSSSQSAQDQWGILEYIDISNGRININGGSIIGYSFGRFATQSIIRYCHSNCTIIGSSAGGICGRRAWNVLVQNCYFDGIINSSFSAGIMGSQIRNAQIENCYNSAVLGNTSNAGIVYSTVTEKTNIYECYNLGNINNTSCGGIINSCIFDIDISNCYNTGQTSSSNCGGFIHSISSSRTVNIINSYSTSTNVLSGTGLLVASNNGTLNIINTCIEDINNAVGTGSANITNMITPLSVIQGQSLPVQWDNNIWTADLNSENFPYLNAFTDISIWSNFTNYLSTPLLIFSYIIYNSPLIFKLNSMILIEPIISPGIPEQPNDFSINKVLPLGLTFDTFNGNISGIPLNTSGTQEYEITVNYPNINSQKSILNLGIATFNYQNNNASYFINLEITPNEPIINGGSIPMSYEISPLLTNGLEFDENTGIIFGTPNEIQSIQFYTINANFSEFSTIDTEISIQTSIFVCLTGNTLIHTNKGIIKLEDICKNHKKYLIKTGEKQPRYSRIYKVFKENYTGDIYKYKDVSMTPEHCFKLKIEDEWVQAQNSPLTTKVNTKIIIYHLSLEKTDDTFLIQASDNETIISDSWNHIEMEAMKEKYLIK